MVEINMNDTLQSFCAWLILILGVPLYGVMIGRIIANEEIANNYFEYGRDYGWDLYHTNDHLGKVLDKVTIKKYIGISHKAFFNSSIFSLFLIYILISWFQFKTWIFLDCISIGIIVFIFSTSFGDQSSNVVKPELLHHADVLSAKLVFFVGYFLLALSYFHQEKQWIEYFIQTEWITFEMWIKY